MFSVVFIVRNEERSLPIAIQSLGIVPEVVVCDTGSVDGTVREARALGATVCEYEWRDDFSAARAFAASQARFDWIVRFDADERLDVIGPSGDPTWLSKASPETQVVVARWVDISGCVGGSGCFCFFNLQF